MRPALYRREFCPPAEKPDSASAPTGIAAPTAGGPADTAPDFATQVVRARLDARRNPALAAMLLSSWMSDHD